MGEEGCGSTKADKREGEDKQKEVAGAVEVMTEQKTGCKQHSLFYSDAVVCEH